MHADRTAASNVVCRGGPVWLPRFLSYGSHGFFHPRGPNRRGTALPPPCNDRDTFDTFDAFFMYFYKKTAYHHSLPSILDSFVSSVIPLGKKRVQRTDC